VTRAVRKRLASINACMYVPLGIAKGGCPATLDTSRSPNCINTRAEYYHKKDLNTLRSHYESTCKQMFFVRQIGDVVDRGLMR
jgi:hypothetical protein